MSDKLDVIETVAKTYNQLYITPEKGVSETGVYADIVHFGKVPPEISEKMKERMLGFKGSNFDKLFSVDSPEGKIKVVYIHERLDFERFLQVMAFKCEPVKISRSLDKAEIVGVVNWRKIEDHMSEYLKYGFKGTDISLREELKKFTANRDNFQDTIIIMTQSVYTELNKPPAGYNQTTWDSLHLSIRLFHSCAKYIYRKNYPDNKDLIWENVIADAVGLLYAFDVYESDMAKRLLGILGGVCAENSRMMVIATNAEVVEDVNIMAERACRIIDCISAKVNKFAAAAEGDYYSLIHYLESIRNS